MEISSQQLDGYDLVKVDGRVDSFTAPKLSEVINNIIQTGRYKIILDLKDVDYVSSAGLRVLIDAQKTCKQAKKGEVILLSVPKRIYETLELAGFVPLFKFFSDLSSAVNSFQ